MSTFESFLKRIVESAFSVDFNSRIVFFRLKVVWFQSIKNRHFERFWNWKILIHFRSYIRSFLFSKNLENRLRFRNFFGQKSVKYDATVRPGVDCFWTPKLQLLKTPYDTVLYLGMASSVCVLPYNINTEFSFWCSEIPKWLNRHL